MSDRIQAFDFMVDPQQALLWQDNLATDLPALLAAKGAWYSAAYTAFWSAWAARVFDLRTADVFGLAVWAAILDLPLLIATGSVNPGPDWGFGALSVSGRQNFTRGNFKGVSGAQGLNVSLEQKRVMLQLWAFRLHSRCDVISVNRFLARVLPGWYVRDNHDMTAAYVAPSDPGQAFRAALLAFDVLPRPCGVSLTIEVAP